MCLQVLLTCAKLGKPTGVKLFASLGSILLAQGCIDDHWCIVASLYGQLGSLGIGLHQQSEYDKVNIAG